MEGWNWKHVYAMLADDGRVKIGISKCVHDRVREIENGKEVKITDYSYTEKCSNPYMVERMIHEELKDFRHFGEWFTVAFEHAVSTMDSIFKKYAKFDEGGNTLEAAEQVFSMFKVDDMTNEKNINSILFAIIEEQNKIINKQDEQIDTLLEAIERVTDSTNKLARYILGSDYEESQEED